MLAAHELLSFYNRNIESDGIYHLSSRIISVLAKMGVFLNYSGQRADQSELTLFTTRFYEIFRGVSTITDYTAECLHGANRNGGFLRNDYIKNKYSKNDVKNDIKLRIQNLRFIIDLNQKANSLVDRAVGQNLNLGKKINDQIIDEILCLKDLEQNILNSKSWNIKKLFHF